MHDAPDFTLSFPAYRNDVSPVSNRHRTVRHDEALGKRGHERLELLHDSGVRTSQLTPNLLELPRCAVEHMAFRVDTPPDRVLDFPP